MPLIAFTREMGSLGVEIADGVGQRLGTPVVYHEIIAPLADKLRLRKSHVVHLLDGGAGVFERLTADRTSMSIYTAEETFGLLAGRSGAVIRSWGATMLLRPVQHAICVRVCAPKELRIRRMMERVGTDDREKIAKEIDASDEAHGAIVRRHFDTDWRNGEHYDLVINTERVPVDEGIEQVLRLVGNPAFQPTPVSTRHFDDLHLEARARGALRSTPDTARTEVGIQAEGPVLTLTGYVGTNAERARVEEVCAALKGVERVQNRLRVSNA